MTLKRIVLLAALAVVVSVFHAETVFSQTGSPLQGEIKRLDAAAARQGIPAAERHNALVRMARLRQLSGDIEGAARNWLEAAAAIPGAVDDTALLSCAFCLAAMGEWDRASAALDPLLIKNSRARFLSACIKAAKTGDTSTLAAIADIPEYSEMKHEILFFLMRISPNDSKERWRQRLINEFPQTAEGKLAKSGGKIALTPNPFWFFLGGFDSLALLASEQRTDNREQIAESWEQRAGSREQRTESREQTNTAQSFARVQTGVFSREANAQTQIASLRNAGFSPSVEQRGDRWAVTVPAGQDANRTISDLHAAGFDSFLVK